MEKFFVKFIGNIINILFYKNSSNSNSYRKDKMSNRFLPSRKSRKVQSVCIFPVAPEQATVPCAKYTSSCRRP